MQIHQLKRKTKQRKARYIGRGGKRGTTSGRGTKGQKARAGHKIRPEIRDIIKKLPKKRGYRVPSLEVKPIVFNIERLEKIFAAGETVSPRTLKEKGLLNASAFKAGKVKILAKGKIAKSLTIEGCLLSAAAKTAIEAAGGKVK